jgi:hypothetical protein
MTMESRAQLSWTQGYVEDNTSTNLCCNYCARLAQEEVKKNDFTYHHPSVISLLESARSCPLCRFFVTLLGEEQIQVAM